MENFFFRQKSDCMARIAKTLAVQTLGSSSKTTLQGMHLPKLKLHLLSFGHS